MNTETALATIQSSWAWIGSLGPAMQPIVAVALACGIPWLLRTAFPHQWQAVTNWATKAATRVMGETLGAKFYLAVQAVPSLVVGAALGVLVSGGDVGETLRVEFYALFSPLLHEWAKRYQGGRFPAAGSAPKP